MLKQRIDLEYALNKSAIEELGFDKEQYIVTEKVHGANFSFHVYRTEDGIQIKCAKRTGYIEDGEKFFTTNQF
jgi:hypothetical protein